MPDTVLDLATEPLVDAADIAHRLSALEQALPVGDGVRWFCTAHVAMSMAVAEDVLAQDFEDAATLERVDLHLVGLFLAAVAADARHGPDEVRSSWRPVFERRSDPDVQALRFALAGINAHIATDLPRAVLAACEEAGIEPSRSSPLYRDYCRINDMEAALRPRVVEQVFSPLMREVDRRLGSVDDLLETYGFVAAREAAWTTADVVHELPGPLAKVHLAVLDRTTGFVNRVMLIG